MRILFVDDNPLMQQVISHYLEIQGYEVVVVGEGAEAIDIARRESFQLYLIDMRLPDQDGPEILASLRTLPDGGRRPAIAVSGLGEEERARTMEAGFDAFLAKPIDLDDLTRMVRRFVAPDNAQAVGI
ncbi:response regulator [Oscillochloris sp. ZM17-4]|uniref:response regulator n=1 Tax=Oscillochloris sp. ZM17-4 TaxID=2866714 RepID=UPI001C73D78E|nr:response regulator [Oscillochloris sp. ZM17-4]MBX0328123.1 response regulator [Oscillochloris sp. ZM17-4]